jgi:hypothetical protein
LVFALFFSLPGLLPAAWGALARIEGSHGVAIGGPDGTLAVVLTHPTSCIGNVPGVHRHGPLARVLTFAAVAEGARDHRVNFLRGSHWLTEEKDSAEADGASGPPCLVAMWEFAPLPEPLPWRVVGVGRDALRSSPALDGVETTRLVI